MATEFYHPKLNVLSWKPVAYLLQWPTPSYYPSMDLMSKRQNKTKKNPNQKKKNPLSVSVWCVSLLMCHSPSILQQYQGVLSHPHQVMPLCGGTLLAAPPLPSAQEFIAVCKNMADHTLICTWSTFLLVVKLPLSLDRSCSYFFPLLPFPRFIGLGYCPVCWISDPNPM